MKELFNNYSKDYNFIETNITVAHNGRSSVVKQYEIEKNRGKPSKDVQIVESFLVSYNQFLVNEAIKKIDNLIKTENEEIENRIKSIRNEYENKIVAQENKVEKRKNNATKGVVIASLVIFSLITFVATAMNFHNLKMLFSGIFSNAIFFIFSLAISSMLGIFAFMQSKQHTKIATFLLPTDFFLTIVLTLFFSENARENYNPVIIITIQILFGLLYTGQVFLITKEFSNIMLDAELRERFFNKLFE